MNLRKTSFLMLFLAGANWVIAVNFIGPPTAQEGQGKWSLGYNYAYSSEDFDTEKWTLYEEGEAPSVHKAKLKDFNVNWHFAVWQFGITDWWDIYLRAGVADMKTQADIRYNDGEREKFGVNFDNDFVWGWGTRLTFARQEKIEWGFTVQMNWLDTSYSENYSRVIGQPGKITIDAEAFDLLAAVGPTIDMDGWKLYGGVLYWLVNGDLSSKEQIQEVIEEPEGPLVGLSSRAKADWDQDKFGAYLGAQFPLMQGVRWSIEGNVVEKGWGVGTGIMFQF